MKPLIYTKYRTHKIAYEEDRLRKSIKGCLEANNIKYATSVFDNYDLVHFIYAKDLSRIPDVKKANKPTIVSALYCETEKLTSMSHYYNSKRRLRVRYFKCLEEADLILVPGQKAKELLEKEGIKTKIEIFPLPINLERFESKNNKDKKILSKFFQGDTDENFILCIGDYQNKLEMENLLEIVSLARFAKFYFLGANYTKYIETKYIKKAPDNIVFTSLVNNDVFRAAMMKSKMLLILDPKKIEAPNVMEAMAANTQVVVYNDNKKKDSYLEDGFNCYMKDGSYEVVGFIENYFKNRIPGTTKKAYEFVKNYSLKNSGERLKKIYQDLIKDKKENLEND